MRILLAIHYPGLMREEFHSVLATHLKQDPNTFLLVFPSFPIEKNGLAHLKEKFGKFRENFICIEPTGGLVRATRFKHYRRQFLQTIKSLQKKCGKNESIEVISFGGAAEICYKDINLPAYKAIMKKLGRGRKLSASSFLPLIYGRRGIKRRK